MKEREVQIITISSVATHPLRKSVLRPENKTFNGYFNGDEAPSTIHFAAKVNSDIIGIVSLYQIACEKIENSILQNTWQLRGLAVDPKARGLGIGKTLIHHSVSFCEEKNAEFIWCNARENVVKLYIKSGFVKVGGRFTIKDIGPHFLMTKTLTDHTS